MVRHGPDSVNIASISIIMTYQSIIPMTYLWYRYYTVYLQWWHSLKILSELIGPPQYTFLFNCGARLSGYRVVLNVCINCLTGNIEVIMSAHWIKRQMQDVSRFISIYFTISFQVFNLIRRLCGKYPRTSKGPLLLTWINLSPSMDK